MFFLRKKSEKNRHAETGFTQRVGRIRGIAQAGMQRGGMGFTRRVGRIRDRLMWLCVDKRAFGFHEVRGRSSHSGIKPKQHQAKAASAAHEQPVSSP